MALGPSGSVAFKALCLMPSQQPCGVSWAIVVVPILQMWQLRQFVQDHVASNVETITKPYSKSSTVLSTRYLLPRSPKTSKQVMQECVPTFGTTFLWMLNAKGTEQGLSQDWLVSWHRLCPLTAPPPAPQT